jgi:beta-galactosidase
MTKALQNPEQPLFSIEFQAGGCHDYGSGDPSLFDLHSRLVVSVGMRAINHYLFVSGENDPLLSPVKRHDWGHPVRQDGSLRQHYYRYPKLSRVLNAYGEALTVSRPETVTTIGFILDYFMTEVNNSFTQESTNILIHQRGEVLFDFIAKGLSVTHRPYNAVDLAHGSLDPDRMPTLWVMMEKQCSPEIQQKLVDYVHAGGKLVLAGRMCEEDFYHNPCEILKDAFGIKEIHPDAPLMVRDIRVFQHQDVPASFLETYSGDFDEVFAQSENGEPAGFVKHSGQGLALVFGAAMTACTLDDIGIVDEMSARLGCEPLFKMDSWLDTRISRGDKGSFLFLNNYQHDPVETTIEYKGQVLFGGHPVKLPARRGLILPLDWCVSPDIRIDYSTAEIIEVVTEGDTVTIKTEPPEFHAQVTLNGYSCSGSLSEEIQSDGKRLIMDKNDGMIVLKKEGQPGLS